MRAYEKKFLTLLAAACIIGFSGCGNSDSTTSAADSAASAAAQESTAAPSSAEENTYVSSESSDSSKAAESTDDTSETAEDTVDPETSGKAGKDTIVIYFSATGTTKGVAERIASVADADIFELIPAEPYSDADLDWHDEKSRTTVEMNDSDVRPAISNDTVDLSGYSTVYIGYPIWWGDAPRMMSTFVEAHDFDGKTVIPFCTSGSSPIGRSGSNLASQAGSGNWLSGGRLESSISEEELKDWINSLN